MGYFLDKLGALVSLVGTHNFLVVTEKRIVSHVDPNMAGGLYDVLVDIMPEFKEAAREHTLHSTGQKKVEDEKNRRGI